MSVGLFHFCFIKAPSKLVRLDQIDDAVAMSFHVASKVYQMSNFALLFASTVKRQRAIALSKAGGHARELSKLLSCKPGRHYIRVKV